MFQLVLIWQEQSVWVKVLGLVQEVQSQITLTFAEDV